MHSSSEKQKLQEAACGELRTACGVVFKVGVALLILESLVWLGGGAPLRREAVAPAPVAPMQQPTMAAAPDRG